MGLLRWYCCPVLSRESQAPSRPQATYRALPKLLPHIQCPQHRLCNQPRGALGKPQVFTPRVVPAVGRAVSCTKSCFSLTQHLLSGEE